MRLPPRPKKNFSVAQTQIYRGFCPKNPASLEDILRKLLQYSRASIHFDDRLPRKLPSIPFRINVIMAVAREGLDPVSASCKSAPDMGCGNLPGNPGRTCKGSLGRASGVDVAIAPLCLPRAVEEGALPTGTWRLKAWRHGRRGMGTRKRGRRGASRLQETAARRSGMPRGPGPVTGRNDPRIASTGMPPRHPGKCGLPGFGGILRNGSPWGERARQGNIAPDVDGRTGKAYVLASRRTEAWDVHGPQVHRTGRPGQVRRTDGKLERACREWANGHPAWWHRRQRLGPCPRHGGASIFHATELFADCIMTMMARSRISSFLQGL